MLPNKNRLRKNKEIEKIAARGRSFFTKIIGIKFLPNRLSFSRFAVVAGLKISKKANQRNLVKRRIREVLRKYIENIKTGYDVIVIARPEILGKKQKDIESNLVYIFGKTILK